MDNAIDGLYISASVLIFIIAVSLTMFLFTQLTETAEVVFGSALQSKHHSEIEVNVDDSKQGSKRIVSKNDVIATLYRYPVQTIAVTILDKSGNEYQVFDKYIESQVRNLSASPEIDLSEIDKAFLQKYNKSGKNLYLFAAPWIGSTRTHRERVDLFVNSEKGYINGKEVDYIGSGSGSGSGKGLSDLGTDKFIETVLTYKISGEGYYDLETGIEVTIGELGTYKTEVIYQAIE